MFAGKKTLRFDQFVSAANKLGLWSEELLNTELTKALYVVSQGCLTVEIERMKRFLKVLGETPLTSKEVKEFLLLAKGDDSSNKIDTEGIQKAF